MFTKPTICQVHSALLVVQTLEVFLHPKQKHILHLHCSRRNYYNLISLFRTTSKLKTWSSREAVWTIYFITYSSTTTTNTTTLLPVLELLKITGRVNSARLKHHSWRTIGYIGVENLTGGSNPPDPRALPTLEKISFKCWFYVRIQHWVASVCAYRWDDWCL